MTEAKGVFCDTGTQMTKAIGVFFDALCLSHNAKIPQGEKNFEGQGVPTLKLQTRIKEELFHHSPED